MLPDVKSVWPVENAEAAKATESNFSALLDRLLARWLG
jgi:hypothetical protein